MPKMTQKQPVIYKKNNGFMIIRKPADQYSDDHLGWGEPSVHLVHLRMVDGPLKAD